MDDRRPLIPGSWSSWLNLALGAWLLLSTFFLGYLTCPPAFWNNVILGTLVVVTSYWATCSESVTPSWWSVAFGVWFIISPLFLNYDGYTQAIANDVICGIIVGLLAANAAVTKLPFGRTRARGV